MDFDVNYSPSEFSKYESENQVIRDKNQFKEEIDNFLGGEDNSDDDDSSLDNESSDDGKD